MGNCKSSSNSYTKRTIRNPKCEHLCRFTKKNIFNINDNQRIRHYLGHRNKNGCFAYYKNNTIYIEDYDDFSYSKRPPPRNSRCSIVAHNMHYSRVRIHSHNIVGDKCDYRFIKEIIPITENIQLVHYLNSYRLEVGQSQLILFNNGKVKIKNICFDTIVKELKVRPRKLYTYLITLIKTNLSIEENNKLKVLCGNLRKI